MIQCFKFFPNCTYSDNQIIKHGKKCYSLIQKDFSVKVSDSPIGYSVRDPSSGKWISYIQRRTKDIPLYPFLIEFAKQVLNERDQVVTVFLLDTPCGYVKIKIIPSLSEVKGKLIVSTLGKAEQSAADYVKIFQIREITDSFGRKPYFVLTNKASIKEAIIDSINRTPIPDELKAKHVAVAQKNVEVIDDPILYCLNQVKRSPEIKVPSGLPSKRFLAGLAAVLLIAGGGIAVKYKKEQEQRRAARMKMLRMQQQAQQWKPSPVFKKNHVAYLFIPEQRNIEKVISLIHPPEGFRVKSLLMNKTAINVVYETPFPIVGGQKKQGGYLVSRNIPKEAGVNWLSLRGTPAAGIPQAEEVIKRFLPYVQRISVENLDGVPVICAAISLSEEVSPVSLFRKLEKLKSTPAIVDQISLQLKENGLYSFEFRGKVCGGKNEKSTDAYAARILNSRGGTISDKAPRKKRKGGFKTP